MRKKERRLITFGLVVLFAAIAWWAYGHQTGAGVLLNFENKTANTTTYQLAISDLAASVDQVSGHVLVTFKLANEEHFNISHVEVLYALNVANPNKATYTALNASEQNGTYKAEIPSKFGDAVYYKVKVVYDGNKTLESEVQSITVKDTTAPTIKSVSIDLKAVKDNKTNTTAYNFDIAFNATDNDQITTYYVYYINLGNKTSLPANATFSVMKSATPEVNIANITLKDNYAFYFVVQDLSGNKAMLYNETSPLIIQANSSATWPQVYPKANASG